MNPMTELKTEERPRETATAPTKPGAAGAPRIRLAAIALVALVVAGGFSIARRFSDHRALARETEALAIPTVSVMKPSSEPAQEELTLPAQLQAYVESSIYSRTNGYLKRWYKDIGSHVRKGELLAQIDAPEIDQELMQAKASRQQILAQMELA